jgi:chromosome segregation ATPase
MNGKPRQVLEEDDDGEGSAEYCAKFAVPNASFKGEAIRLDRKRLVELERQLSALLAAKTERDQHLAQLTDELAMKSALLERAEAEAAEATKRAGLERADRLLAQTSLVEQKDAELVNMQAKLDELLLSRDQHVRALEQAQSALQKAISRAADGRRAEPTCLQTDWEI